MRLSFIFIFAALMQVSASSLAQKITLSERQATLETILQKIRLQTGYDFLYDVEAIKSAKPIDINVRNSSLTDALNSCLAGQDFSFTIDDKSVIIRRKEPSFLALPKPAFANIDARGKILDEKGSPLEGATVVLKGTSRTAKTDAKGEFVIPNVPDDAVLVIRYVGFKTLEIPLQGAVLPLEIKLNFATGELEEVKVVYNTGYQELNKERATGSFVHIDNELFNRRVGATVLDRIKDLVAGVYTTTPPAGSGTGNALDEFTIRGVSTFSASKRPLLVVDNFIYDGNPNTINPNDVESVTILKDAAAASIWGVRSGNGVIVITMKKGKASSRPIISFNTNVSLTEKPDLFSIPIIPSKDIIALEKQRFDRGYYNAAISNTSIYPVVSAVVEILTAKRTGRISASEADAQIALLENHDVRKDVDKYLVQIPVAQQYALSISGGGNAYQYYGSVGYDRNRSTDINKSNERLSMRFSNTWQPIKNLEVRMEMIWGEADNNNKNSLSGIESILTSPYHRLADAEGNALAIANKYRMAYVDTVRFPGQLDWHYRPLDEAGNGNQHTKAYNTVINGGLSYTLIRGLKASIDYQWQKTTSSKITIKSIETFYTRDLINRFTTVGTNGLPNYPYPLGGVYEREGAEQKAWNLRGLLSFDRTFGQHAISAILGLENNESNTGAWSASIQYGYNPQTSIFGVPQHGTWKTRPGNSNQTIAVGPGSVFGNLNRFGSSFGNIGYTFMSKYTLTSSARIDESNFFGVKANDRKVPLWSAGLGWQISKEGFYKLDWLPNLRLSATYGYNGNVNAGTSPLATIEYLNPIDYTFLPRAQVRTPPNPQLRWERVRNLNLALDFGTKNQRITGRIDFFKKQGIDLLSPIEIDPTSGFTTYTGNQSSMQVRGFDLNITGRNINGLFKWFTTVTFGYQQNKVTAYTGIPLTQGQTGSSTLIGKPQNSIFAYRWAGLNPLDGSSRFYLANQVVAATTTNLIKATQDDLIYIGQSNPPIFGAFRNDIRFKNIAFSFNISYQFGHYFRRSSFTGNFGSITSYTTWQHQDYLNAWKVPGDEKVTNVPAFLDTYPDNRYLLYQNADILIEKADHIRLQDIRLSYDVDRSIIKGLPFKQASFYIHADNIGILWKASKYSPDTQGGLSVRRLRTLTMGLNVSF